jgi:hypothetical protein
VAKIDSDRPDGNVDAMVGNACHQIRNAVAAAYSRSTLGLLPSTALAIGYYNDFVDKVCLAFSDPPTWSLSSPARKLLLSSAVADKGTRLYGAQCRWTRICANGLLPT